MDIVTTSFNDGEKHALLNYIEIIQWYRKPFYKRIFSSPPVKQLISINKQTR